MSSCPGKQFSSIFDRVEWLYYMFLTCSLFRAALLKGFVGCYALLLCLNALKKTCSTVYKFSALLKVCEAHFNGMPTVQSPRRP